MVESDMQVIFGAYIRSHNLPKSAVFELKICKGTALPFNSVKEHQRKALLAVLESGFYHKLIDPPIFANMKTRFNAPRPFDCFFLKGIEAFVIIWFYHARKPKTFILISIKEFLAEEARSSRKSLTEARAKEISSGTIMI